MNNVSKIILPVFIVFIIIYALRKKVDIYETFLKGAKEGISMSIGIVPAIIAMIFAINIFLDSNFLEFCIKGIVPFLNSINVPYEIVPMAVLRPISGTATLSIMNDIFIKYGADSYIGNLASILQGCTDTTFYVLALYFSSVKITKSKYALKVGLFADFIGIVLAVLLTGFFFS